MSLLGFHFTSWYRTHPWTWIESSMPNELLIKLIKKLKIRAKKLSEWKLLPKKLINFSFRVFNLNKMESSSCQQIQSTIWLRKSFSLKRIKSHLLAGRERSSQPWTWALPEHLVWPDASLLSHFICQKLLTTFPRLTSNFLNSITNVAVNSSSWSYFLKLLA